MLIATNSFRWRQWYEARKRDLNDHLDEALAAAARAGIQSWEHGDLPTDEIARRLGAALNTHGLQARSLYINARLHEENWRDGAVNFLTQARRGIALGARIIVTNPEPIRWGSDEAKTDTMLSRQLEALRFVIEQLRREGAELAYHVHAPELAHGAREFHHMMLNTADLNMGFGLDPHWIYRGCGDSHIALDDVVKLYGARVNLLHIRQSRGGIWTETLCDGDIDYKKFFGAMRAFGFEGVVNVELGFEPGVPETMSLEQMHAKSVEWLVGKLGERKEC
jgi:inosose dehydratase